MTPIGLAVVGVGGFARSYLESVAAAEREGLCRLLAVVVRSPERYPEELALLKKRGVRVFATLSDLCSRELVRFVAIPTGIDSHADYSETAMNFGLDVLCVKPVAGSLSEAKRMQAVRDRTGRVLAIGFQDIFTPSVQRIKSIILAGSLGRLVRARAYLSWPRSRLYYERNAWAGRISVSGRPVYDSPIQNAAAHYLNQMLYVAGPTRECSLNPAEVWGENYRAKRIESADTQFVRVTGTGGIKISLLASHAVQEFSGPVICYELEGGRIEWHRELEGRSGFTKVEPSGHPGPGNVEEFDNGEISPRDAVFYGTLRAIADGEVPHCTIDNAIQHTAVVEAAFASSGRVVAVPEDHVSELSCTSGPQDGGMTGRPTVNRVIRGYESEVSRMFASGTGPWEAGLSWASAPTPVETSHLLDKR